MNVPDYFEMADGYACFRPKGQASIQQIADMVSEAITFTSACNVTRLLADTTQLFGFQSPGTFERFKMVEQWANTSQGVKLALVARSEMIDPKRFGTTVGRNRGLNGEIFDSEADAVAWLMGKKS